MSLFFITQLLIFAMTEIGLVAVFYIELIKIALTTVSVAWIWKDRKNIVLTMSTIWLSCTLNCTVTVSLISVTGRTRGLYSDFSNNSSIIHSYCWDIVMCPENTKQNGYKSSLTIKPFLYKFRGRWDPFRKKTLLHDKELSRSDHLSIVLVRLEYCWIGRNPQITNQYRIHSVIDCCCGEWRISIPLTPNGRTTTVYTVSMGAGTLAGQLGTDAWTNFKLDSAQRCHPLGSEKRIVF